MSSLHFFFLLYLQKNGNKSIFIAHKLHGFPHTIPMERTVPSFLQKFGQTWFPLVEGSGEELQLAVKLPNPLLNICLLDSVHLLPNCHQFHNPLCLTHKFGPLISPPAKSHLLPITRGQSPPPPLHEIWYLGKLVGGGGGTIL